jgi:hypothetical protein
MLGRAKKPGFCDKCGSPQESIAVCYKDAPYDEKTGQIKVVRHVMACTKPTCVDNKWHGEWSQVSLVGYWPQIWVGLVPPKAATAKNR